MVGIENETVNHPTGREIVVFNVFDIYYIFYRYFSQFCHHAHFFNVIFHYYQAAQNKRTVTRHKYFPGSLIISAQFKLKKQG